MPKPNEIRKARVAARLTQRKAADLVKVHINTWGLWEAGRHAMPESTYEYFRIITQTRGQ